MKCRSLQSRCRYCSYWIGLTADGIWEGDGVAADIGERPCGNVQSLPNFVVESERGPVVEKTTIQIGTRANQMGAATASACAHSLAPLGARRYEMRPLLVPFLVSFALAVASDTTAAAPGALGQITHATQRTALCGESDLPLYPFTRARLDELDTTQNC